MACTRLDTEETIKPIEEIKKRLEKIESQNFELIRNNKELIDINLKLVQKVNGLEKKIDILLGDKIGKIKIEEEKDKKEEGKERKETEEEEDKEEREFLAKSKGLTNKIIKTYEEAKQLHDWILPKKARKFKLIFNPSIDGNKFQDFRKKCIDKGAWLFIAETTSRRRFGGYSSIGLSKKKGQSRAWIFDKDSFLFSIDFNEKYKNIKKHHSIGDNPSFSICFGKGGNICIDNNFLTGYHSENYSIERCYDVPGDASLSGDYTFKLYKLEVYQVLEE